MKFDCDYCPASFDQIKELFEHCNAEHKLLSNVIAEKAFEYYKEKIKTEGQELLRLSKRLSELELQKNQDKGG